ncbi:MAG: carboxylesterase family protein [Acidobacteria bacterium]|nr:carboxylesterase family protein [Acidobacteriota bacterium]
MESNRVARFILAAAGAALLSACGAPAAVDAPDVPLVSLSANAPISVTGGDVQGAATAANPDVIAFKGIPFAAPPVGDLRWRPPAPVVSWTGVRDATATGPICVQNGGQDVTQDEDCLFLNVWAPRETTELRPVLFWIHGGGYTGGSGSSALYDGTALAGDGAVVVTINYRLNVFGFLAHPALSDESPHGASGNYGLLDMVAALEWVRDNIATFGGDPDRVMIFGESAGGGAVMSVMLMPQAEGLYHRAIAQSNYIRGWDRPLDSPARGWEPAETQGVRIGDALGPNGDDAAEQLAAMRATSAAEVLEASNRDAGNTFRNTGHVWAPNVDGWAIPDDPLAMYEDGRQHDVPLITGLMGNEGSLFTRNMDIADVGSFEAYVRAVYPEHAEQMLAHYTVDSPESAKAGIDKLIHDFLFAGPVRAHAETHAKKMSPVWLYHFTHAPPTAWGETLGAHHAAELVYVFGTLTRTDDGGERPLGLGTMGDFAEADFRLSETVRNYWIQFAATGNPNRPDLPDWPAFNLESNEHLILSTAAAPASDLDVAGAALWNTRQTDRRESN